MPQYRRAEIEGGTFFLTLVTHRRTRLFLDERARGCLRESMRAVRSVEPFDLIDLVLLPDHLHLLIRLPDGDADFSARVSRLKTGFTRRWLADGGAEADQSASRDAQGYRGVWQKRFWEHAVRGDDDLVRCREYVYANPVKHGLCRCPHDWPWSSFGRAVAAGDMPGDWRCVCDGRESPRLPDVPGAELDD
ncbi:MAG TPA: transposase [Tepidisphaeraceae bacterium]|jgi:putative transposase